jgi:hypothetical protein
VVRLALGGGLVTPAGEAAALVAQRGQAAQAGRDLAGLPGIQREGRAAQRPAQQVAARRVSARVSGDISAASASARKPMAVCSMSTAWSAVAGTAAVMALISPSLRLNVSAASWRCRRTYSDVLSSTTLIDPTDISPEARFRTSGINGNFVGEQIV